MALFVSGLIGISFVSSNAEEHNISGVFQLGVDHAVEVKVRYWSVVPPNEGEVYLINGKLSFSSEENLFFIHALQMNLVPGAPELAPPPFISGEAIVCSVSSDAVSLDLLAYAGGNKENLKMECLFIVRQYGKFAAGLSVGAPLLIGGSLSAFAIEGKRIVLVETQFAYPPRAVSKPKVNSQSATPIKGFSSPKKRAEEIEDKKGSKKAKK